MPKKPSKAKAAPSPQPEPAQIRALERLIASGQYPAAVERARSLVQRFPDHGGVRRSLVEALALGQGHAHAALAAYQWAAHRPNSRPALEALLRLAIEGDHLFLANRTATRLVALGAETRGSPLALEIPPELLEQPDGSSATQGQLEQFDIGKLHLQAHDFAGAVGVLEGVPLTPARNNRALCLFHLGRIQEALAACLEAWQHDPDNLFALGFALQLRLYAGAETGARGLGVPLAQAQARRAEDAEAQLAALLLIHEDQAAWDAFQRSRAAPWMETERARHGAGLLHLGACAAARLGQDHQAQALWQQALRLNPKLSPAAANLNAPRRDAMACTYPEVFDQGRVLPVGWLETLIGGGAADLASRGEALSASDTYLEAIYLGGDRAVRALVAVLLKQRLPPAPPRGTGEGQRGAAAILRKLARLPIGTADERRGFLIALRERGLVAADEAVEFWNGTALQTVSVIGRQIDREPAPSPLPAHPRSLLDKSVDRFREGRLDEAETLLNALLEQVPDYPVALGNLAAIRAQQGRGEASRALLRQAIAADPDYLLARCNLAALLIEDGGLDEAQGLLTGLAQRPRLHIQEVFALDGVLAMLHRARGEDEAADALMANLERLTETDLDARMLALAKRRVELTTPQGRFAKILKTLLNSPPRPDRPKRR